MIFLVWPPNTKQLIDFENDNFIQNLRLNLVKGKIIITNIKTGQKIENNELINKDILLITNDDNKSNQIDKLKVIPSTEGYKTHFINISARRNATTQTLIYKKILEILTEKLLTTTELLKEKLSSETSLRKDYSSLNESFALVEHFIKSSNPSSFESNFYFPPTAEKTTIALSSGSSLVQCLPCNSIGFASASFYIENNKSIESGTLECQVVTDDDETICALWTIKINNNCPKVCTLAMPQSLGPEEKSLKLVINWMGHIDIRLKSSYEYPNKTYLPEILGVEILGVKESRILAMEVKKILPRLRVNCDVEAFLPSPIKDRSNYCLSWRNVPPKVLKNFQITGEGDNNSQYIRFNEETAKLQVHVPSDGIIASTTLTQEWYSKAKKIKCKIKTLNEKASPISYQLIAESSSKIDGAITIIESEWFEIEPMKESEILINLDEDFGKPFKIIFKTKLSNPKEQSSDYGWSNFYDLQFYI